MPTITLSNEIFQWTMLFGVLLIISLLSWLVGFFYSQMRTGRSFIQEDINQHAWSMRGDIRAPALESQPALSRMATTPLSLSNKGESREATPQRSNQLSKLLKGLQTRFNPAKARVFATRVVTGFLLVGVLGAGGYFGYQTWQEHLGDRQLPFAPDARVSADRLDDEPLALPLPPSTNLPTITPPISDKVYEQTDIGIRLTYPTDWQIEPFSPTWGLAYDSQTRLHFRLQSPTASLYVEVQVEANPEGRKLDDWIADRYASTYLEKSTDFSIDGYQAEQRAFRNPHSNMRTVVLFIDRGTSILTLSRVAALDVAQTDAAWQTSEDLVRSLELL